MSINLLSATVGLIALLAFFSPSDYSPITLKSSIGISLILVLFLAWFYRNILAKNSFFIKSNLLYIPIAVFLIWAAVSSFWSVNIFYTVTTLAQLVSYAMLYFLVYNLLKYKYQVNFILIAFIVVGTIVSIIGLIQFYFVENSFIQSFFTQGAWPASTFGNKNFAMHIIVMVVPIVIIYLLTANLVRSVWILALILLINLAYWGLSFTRAAWISVAVQLFFLLFFILFNKNKPMFMKLKLIKHKIFSSFVVLISMMVILTSNPNANMQPHNGSVKERIQSISTESANPRIPAWINTIEMISDQPLIGVGVGQWPVIYPMYHDRRAFDVILNETTTLKHLHNEYLELFANYGLIGYIFIIWVFISSALMLLRVLKSNRNTANALIIFLSLLGFLIESFFSFPIKAYYPMLFVIIMLALLSHIYDLSYLNGKTYKYRYDKNTVVKKYIVNIFFAFLMIFSVVIFYFSYSWALSEKYREYAYVFERNHDYGLAKSAAMRSKNYLSFLPDIQNIVGTSELNLGNYKKAIESLMKSINYQPYQSNALFNLSLAYRSLNNFQKELEVLETLTKINPNHFRAHAAMARIYYVLNDLDMANMAYNKMKLYFFKQKDRAGFLPHYDVVGKTAMLVKDFKFAKFIYTEFLKNTPNAENYKILGSLYLISNNKPDRRKGVELFKRSLELDPYIKDYKYMESEIKRFLQDDTGESI